MCMRILTDGLCDLHCAGSSDRLFRPLMDPLPGYLVCVNCSSGSRPSSSTRKRERERESSARRLSATPPPRSCDPDRTAAAPLDGAPRRTSHTSAPRQRPAPHQLNARVRLTFTRNIVLLILANHSVHPGIIHPVIIDSNREAVFFFF